MLTRNIKGFTLSEAKRSQLIFPGGFGWPHQLSEGCGMSPGRRIFFLEAVVEPKESLFGFQQLCSLAVVPRLLWSKGAEFCGRQSGGIFGMYTKK